MSPAITWLTILSGLFWSVVYVESIRLGLKQKTYAMPFWALALNLAWEGQYTLVQFMSGSHAIQDFVNAIWFLLDLGLLYTYLRFGKRHFPAAQQDKFWLWTLGGLISAVGLQYLFLKTFTLGPAAVYSAFLQNLLMSVLFINMWAERKNNEGQNLVIAISKGLGTLAATLSFGLIGLIPGTETFALTTGLLIFIFDTAYIILLWQSQPQP